MTRALSAAPLRWIVPVPWLMLAATLAVFYATDQSIDNHGLHPILRVLFLGSGSVALLVLLVVTPAVLIARLVRRQWRAWDRQAAEGRLGPPH